MQQTFQHPLPTILPDQIDAAIVAVEYLEVGDGCTTVATVTLDNGFVVTGTHSFARAKHFVASEGRDLALYAARLRALELLQFRAMDRAMNGAPLGMEAAPPTTPYPAGHNYEQPFGFGGTPGADPPAPIDDTLHIRITDAAGNSHELAFDPTPDEGPADAQPADPAPAAE